MIAVNAEKMSVRFIVMPFVLLSLYSSMRAHAQTSVNISGDQSVREGSNVTFKCVVSSSTSGQIRSNWLLIFPDDDRGLANIRFQGGGYTPENTNTSLFHVPDIFPGLQEEFTFVRIGLMFDMVEVQCFNGGNSNSSFINIITPYVFGENVTVTEPENTTGFFSVNVIHEGDDKDLDYTWTRNGVPLESDSRVVFMLTGINFTDGGGGMKRSDLGVYRLNISNFGGYAVTYLTLDVQYAPVIAGSEGQQPFPFEIGSDYDIITCGLNLDTGPMLDGNPFPTVMWSFNGSTIANNSDKYTIDNNNLIVRNISRDDAGLYNCTATNMVGFDTIVYDVQTYAIPSSPVNVEDDNTTNTTVVIIWDAPEDTDGLPVHSYLILIFNDNNLLEQRTRTMDNDTTVTLTNLLPGLNYTVMVAAITQQLGRLFEGNFSDQLTFTTMNGRPVLNEAISSTIGNDVITIEWTVLTTGGEPIVRSVVDWSPPGSNEQYTTAPGGMVEGDATYLNISLGRVFAGLKYKYRIQAVNSEGYSNFVFHELTSSQGLPASPSTPRVIVEGSVVLVVLRAHITGIVSNNVTLVFEVEAAGINSQENVTQNFTITAYVSPHDTSVPFEGLRGRSYYTFRSRVFNIYGPSEYSSSTDEIFISEGTVDATDESDDDDDDTGIIIGAVVGGTLLLIFVLLVLFIILYVLFHHRTHAASYTVNESESPVNAHVDDTSNTIPQYADNPQYGTVKMGNSLSAYDDVDMPIPMIKNDSDANEKRPFELTISVKNNEKPYLYPVKGTGDLVSPQHSAASSTLV